MDRSPKTSPTNNMRLLLSLALSLIAFGEPALAQFAARTHFFTSQSAYDSDAAAWIAAVETADGQSLETGVKAAMNQFVRDLKSNSLWSSVTSMTVLMGARTLNGALIDIKNPSTSWTNINFVSGDYNRNTGLLGNGSSKYLDSNIAGNAMSQDNVHAFVHVHTITTIASGHYFGSGITSTNGATSMRRSSSTTTLSFRCRTNSESTQTSAHATGLMGLSRSASGSYTSRGSQGNQTNSVSSVAALSQDFWFFTANNAGSSFAEVNARIRICSVGTALNLATAETVTDTYIASIVALGL